MIPDFGEAFRTLFWLAVFAGIGLGAVGLGVGWLIWG